MKRVGVMVVAILAAAVLAVAALTHPATLVAFNKLVRPPAGTALSKAGCAICHVGTTKALNPYGLDLQKAMRAAKTKTLSADILKKTAKLDSDKDKAVNEKELKAGTLPGDPKSKPGK